MIASHANIAVITTYGTMAQSSAGNNGTSLANHGLQFANIFAGTVTQAKFACAQSGSSFTARIYTDNAGSPGTQVNGNSDSTGGSVADLTFTWSSNPPVLSAGVTYWLVVIRATSTVLCDTCTAVGGIVTGSNATITSIVDGGNVTAGRDLRMGCTVTP